MKSLLPLAICILTSCGSDDSDSEPAAVPIAPGSPTSYLCKPNETTASTWDAYNRDGVQNNCRKSWINAGYTDNYSTRYCLCMVGCTYNNYTLNETKTNSAFVFQNVTDNFKSQCQTYAVK